MSTINLLPDDYLKRRGQRRSNIVCMILFAIVLVGVIGANMVTRQSERHTLRIRDRVNEEYATATRLIEHMQSLEKQKAVMLQKGQVTASLVERMPRSTVLAMVVSACPKGVSLSEVNLLCKPVRRTSSPTSGSSRRGRRRRPNTLSTTSRKESGPPPVEVTMTVAGLAETDTQVARFIANLAASRPLIKDVNLIFSQEKFVYEDAPPAKPVKGKSRQEPEKVVVREFEVKLQLAPKVDAREMVKRIIDGARLREDDGQEPEEDAEREAVG